MAEERREGEERERSLELKLREVRDITVIDVEGRIDINASELIELIGWLLKRGKIKLLLNLERVGLVDYSGLSVLAITYKNVRNHNGTLKFVAVPFHIVKLLRVAQLTDVFELHEEEQLAVESFDQPVPEILNKPLRRRYKRLEVANIPVQFIPSHRESEGYLYEGKAMNLGGEGLLLCSQKIFPLKTEMTLQLELSHPELPLVVKGQVIWIADKELQPHYFPGMGIQFHPFSPESEKCLFEFIDRHITQRSD